MELQNGGKHSSRQITRENAWWDEGGRGEAWKWPAENLVMKCTVKLAEFFHKIEVWQQFRDGSDTLLMMTLQMKVHFKAINPMAISWASELQNEGCGEFWYTRRLMIYYEMMIIHLSSLATWKRSQVFLILGPKLEFWICFHWSRKRTSARCCDLVTCPMIPANSQQPLQLLCTLGNGVSNRAKLIFFWVGGDHLLGSPLQKLVRCFQVAIFNVWSRQWIVLYKSTF